MALNKNHRLAFAAVFALLFVLAPPLYAEEKPVAVLAEISGTILINSHGSWGVKPEVNLPLYSGDRVVTRVGTAKVLFSDGAVLDIQKIQPHHPGKRTNPGYCPKGQFHRATCAFVPWQAEF